MSLLSGAAAPAHRQRGQRIPDEPRLQLPDPEGDPEPGPARPAAAGAGGPHGSRPAAGELAGPVKNKQTPLYPAGYRGRGQLVKKGRRPFLTKGLQSAARIICSLEANKFHTCRLRSIFCQVHAPAKNGLHLICRLRAANSARLF